MPNGEELVCTHSQRKKINWTPNAWLNSTSHPTGFSTSKDFNTPKVQKDWISHNCQFLGLDIPHLKGLQPFECPCKRFAIDDTFKLRRPSAQLHATRRSHDGCARAHTTALQRAGYRTERRKKGNLWRSLRIFSWQEYGTSS